MDEACGQSIRGTSMARGTQAQGSAQAAEAATAGCGTCPCPSMGGAAAC